MSSFTPATYRFPESFRFRHVKPGLVFEVTEESQTDSVPAGHYVRATKRKALPCTYSPWSGPQVNASSGVVYVPADLPVIQTQV